MASGEVCYDGVASDDSHFEYFVKQKLGKMINARAGQDLFCWLINHIRPVPYNILLHRQLCDQVLGSHPIVWAILHVWYLPTAPYCHHIATNCFDTGSQSTSALEWPNSSGIMWHSVSQPPVSSNKPALHFWFVGMAGGQTY